MKLKEQFDKWMVEKGYCDITNKGSLYFERYDQFPNDKMHIGYQLEFLGERYDFQVIHLKDGDFTIKIYNVNDKVRNYAFDGKTLSEALDKIMELEGDK